MITGKNIFSGAGNSEGFVPVSPSTSKSKTKLLVGIWRINDDACNESVFCGPVVHVFLYLIKIFVEIMERIYWFFHVRPKLRALVYSTGKGRILHRSVVVKVGIIMFKEHLSFMEKVSLSRHLLGTNYSACVATPSHRTHPRARKSSAG